MKNKLLAYSLIFSLLLIIKKEVSPREGKILLFEINLKLKKKKNNIMKKKRNVKKHIHKDV